MRWYSINQVCFDLKEKSIKVKNNYGNKIYYNNIETARKVYKAIKNGDIKIQDTYDAFETVSDIRKMVNQLEGR